MKIFISCDEAGSSFLITEINLRHLTIIHILCIDHINRKFVCPVCGHATSRGAEMRVHFDLEGPFHYLKCTICQKEITSWDQHVKHVSNGKSPIISFVALIISNLFSQPQAGTLVSVERENFFLVDVSKIICALFTSF